MNKVFITDYIDNPEIEKEVLGDELCNDLNDSIEVLLVWHKTIDKKLAYTNKDKYDILRQKNPLIEEFRKSLGLSV